MIGIKSYGAYIPFNRLTRKCIGEAYGKKAGAGERSVANYDEDSITMAVAAALDCTSGYDTKKIDAAYFASTTSPYDEKQCATVLSGALDMRRDIRTSTLQARCVPVLLHCWQQPMRQPTARRPSWAWPTAVWAQPTVPTR